MNTPMHLRWRFPSSDPLEARRVRAAIVASLSERYHGDVAAAEVVLGELLSNAQRHGRPGDVTVEVEMRERPTVRVASPGDAFAMPSGPPPAHSIGGRGLLIVRSFASEPEVSATAGECTVTVALRLAPRD